MEQVRVDSDDCSRRYAPRRLLGGHPDDGVRVRRLADRWKFLRPRIRYEAVTVGHLHLCQARRVERCLRRNDLRFGEYVCGPRIPSSFINESGAVNGMARLMESTSVVA